MQNKNFGAIMNYFLILLIPINMSVKALKFVLLFMYSSLSKLIKNIFCLTLKTEK